MNSILLFGFLGDSFHEVGVEREHLLVEGDPRWQIRSISTWNDTVVGWRFLEWKSFASDARLRRSDHQRKVIVDVEMMRFVEFRLTDLQTTKCHVMLIGISLL